ncbi:DUF6461 domain-containing protein [Streptomyces sp. NPDC001910]|uniref:DUF6461 domain-containing protein n=1 Tax=Streptomyces sp. NPDC001910 TaxID=3154403 RepID=UPI0033339632
MSDGLLWLLESFPEGFSVSFMEGVQPEVFIQTLGGEPEHTLALTRDQAEAIEMHARHPDAIDLDTYDLDEEEMMTNGFIRPGVEVLRFGKAGTWAFAIQSFGSYATSNQLPFHASLGRRFISFSRTTNTACWVQYIVDGTVASSFDPLHPKEGTEDGFSITEIATSEHPDIATLRYLERQFSLEVPKSSDFRPLRAAAFG